jgi:4,5-DOPA dioxygenase extradiol
MTRLPTIFFGHGNPMNAIEPNRWAEAWAKLGRELPRPRAILCVSAHWYLPATLVTAQTRPPTIHDFGGFPRALFEVEYPAPGDRALCDRVVELLAPAAAPDERWGLDHGTWSVLCHVYPDAGVPVVQLSIDETLPAAAHYDYGRRLAPLRDEDVLVIGSGNLVHNLHAFAWGRHPAEPYDWAVRFETDAKNWIASGEHDPLIRYEALGRDAQLSAPTPDHFLPLLYVLGAAHPGEPVTFPAEGIDGGSVSMLTVQIG